MLPSETMSTSTAPGALGLLSLLSDAGPVAKFVLLLLLIASIQCWAIIWGKRRTIRKAQSEDEQFLHIFWNGKSVDDILSRSEKLTASPTATIFRSGTRELRKLIGPPETPQQICAVKRAVSEA